MITWLKEKLNPTYKFNEKEQLIMDIVTNLCEQHDTNIKMAPISGRYFLVNKRLEYWVKIGDDGITITNHRFTYSNMSPQQFQTIVIKAVENAIEKSRNEFEAAVFQNEVELLENIVINIKIK
jgi:hypothetical protein